MSVEKYNCMIGATIFQIDGAVGDEKISFHGRDGSTYVFWYEHDCCARCSINDIVGDLDDLIGKPIVEAEMVSCDSDGEKPDEYSESFTWSFYRFSTVKGTVTIRWLGESNGYYSETVSFRHEKP